MAASEVPCAWCWPSLAQVTWRGTSTPRAPMPRKTQARDLLCLGLGWGDDRMVPEVDVGAQLRQRRQLGLLLLLLGLAALLVATFSHRRQILGRLHLQEGR